MGTPGSATPAEPEGGKAPDLSHTAPGPPPSEPAQPEPTQPEPDPDVSPPGDPADGSTRYAPGRVRMPEGGGVPEPDQSAGRGDGAGRSELPVARPAKHPPDPIRPFLGKPLPWRRARDWGTLILAMIITAILLAACCAAGFAFYATRGAN